MKRSTAGFASRSLTPSPMKAALPCERARTSRTTSSLPPGFVRKALRSKSRYAPFSKCSFTACTARSGMPRCAASGAMACAMPRSTLFPYTTLFRSMHSVIRAGRERSDVCRAERFHGGLHRPDQIKTPRVHLIERDLAVHGLFGESRDLGVSISEHVDALDGNERGVDVEKDEAVARAHPALRIKSLLPAARGEGARRADEGRALMTPPRSSPDRRSGRGSGPDATHATAPRTTSRSPPRPRRSRCCAPRGRRSACRPRRARRPARSPWPGACATHAARPACARLPNPARRSRESTAPGRGTPGSCARRRSACSCRRPWPRRARRGPPASPRRRPAPSTRGSRSRRSAARTRPARCAGAARARTRAGAVSPARRRRSRGCAPRSAHAARARAARSSLPRPARRRSRRACRRDRTTPRGNGGAGSWAHDSTFLDGVARPGVLLLEALDEDDVHAVEVREQILRLLERDARCGRAAEDHRLAVAGQDHRLRARLAEDARVAAVLLVQGMMRVLDGANALAASDALADQLANSRGFSSS